MGRSRRERQTRLTFNQLPSSSPAKTQYSPAVQDLLSGVGYSQGPSKKRKVTFDAETDTDDSKANPLPTPAKSSQAPDGSAKARLSQSKRKRRSKQGEIDFSNHIGVRLEDETSKRKPDGIASGPRAGLKKNPFRGTNSAAMEVSSDSSDDDDDEGSPHDSSPPRSSRRTRASAHVAVQKGGDDDEESEYEDEPVRHSARKSKPRGSIVISSDEEGEAGQDADWGSVLGSDSALNPDNRTQLEDIGEPETSGDEVMQSSPMRKARHGRCEDAEKANQIADLIRAGGLPVGNSVGLAAGSSHGKKRKQRTPKDSPGRRGRAKVNEDEYEEDNFVVDDDEEVEVEDEDDEPPRGSRKARTQVQPDSDSEDDIPQTPGKRRRLTQKDSTSSRNKSRREEEDLAEDLEFLGSAKKSPSRLRSSAPTGRPDPRREALEEFKRRRAGISDDAPSSTRKPAATRRKALYDTDSEDEQEENDVESLEEDESVDAEPTPTAREMFEEDEGEDDFIDEDDDPLGVPDADAQLPLAYSNLRFAKAKDLFKYAVEWMVQKKLNPAFSITDEVYALTFSKLNDEAQGLTGSKFKSAAWTPEFTRTLNARPHISVAESGADGMHHCEACNRKSHPATWQVQFSGKPYNTKTLEDLEQDDDDDDDASSDGDEDDETPVYDAIGNLIPPTSHVFHLGRTCQQNASTAHALEHWRYHLNDWVIDYLKMQGYLKPDRIVERDGWKTKKRRKFANKVTDEMEESGEISTLYKVFKAEIEAAHEAKGSGYERFS